MSLNAGGESQMDHPARNAEVVTPSDVTELVYESRALYVGVGGNISVQMAGTGTAIVFTGVPAGTILPIRIARVNSTSTTATNMVSLY
jgi:hypothetical protein